jgi:hypothetical protein
MFLKPNKQLLEYLSVEGLAFCLKPSDPLFSLTTLLSKPTNLKGKLIVIVGELQQFGEVVYRKCHCLFQLQQSLNPTIQQSPTVLHNVHCVSSAQIASDLLNCILHIVKLSMEPRHGLAIVPCKSLQKIVVDIVAQPIYIDAVDLIIEHEHHVVAFLQCLQQIVVHCVVLSAQPNHLVEVSFLYQYHVAQQLVEYACLAQQKVLELKD